MILCQLYVLHCTYYGSVWGSTTISAWWWWWLQLRLMMVMSPDPGVVGQHQGCPTHGQLWPWWEEQHEL